MHEISRYERHENRRTDWPILDKPDNGLGIGKFLGAGLTIALLAKPKAEELLRWGVSLDGLDEMLVALDEAHQAKGRARVNRVSSTNVLPS